MLELQDILNACGEEFRQSHPLSPVQAKAFRDILNCRTAVLGAHIDTCDECGFEKISYNSCRNRHCPKCQAFVKEQWIEKQNRYLLNTGYFHVVFTLPDELNPLLLHNQEITYNLFFKAVSQTLLELCTDVKYLGAIPGVTTVLHTWGQNLMYHPHIHCIVTGGGLSSDNQWRTSRKKFFIPVKVLSRKFRGKFLFFLKQAGLSLCPSLYQKEWVVYCKPPFKNVSKVVEYLGRYTHRVAISNNRILELADGKVTFSWRDYRDNKKKTMIVTAVEFIRRFMLHILPHGFRKIRHYGLLAARDKSERISLCKKLTHTLFPRADHHVSTLDKLLIMFGADFNLCPCCGVGHLARAAPAKAIA
ncbi:MAG: IS91 family transposase [Firmicutes bacterium]|nr:IS91 family transposase [Bacillota bacterium]